MKRIFFLLFLVLGPALCASAAVPPAEKLLPDDTLIVFSIPDFTRVREIYHSSPQGRFWSDPSMKAFTDKFMTKLQTEFLTPLEHDLGAHFTDYTNFLQGQLTVAMVQNGWQGKDKDPKEPGLLFLLDTRDKSPQLKSTLADLKKKWVDAGKTARTEKIRDIDFSVIVLSSNDVPKSLKQKTPSTPGAPEPMEDPDAKNAPKQQIYIGQAGSLLIVGNSSKAIEKVLAVMSGGSVNTLGDQAAFSSAAGMFHDASSFGWINVKAFVDIFIHRNDGSDEAPNPFGLDPAKIVTALGFNGLKSIAFNYRYSPDGAQFNLMLGIPEAERTGIFKILAGEPKDYNPPAFVPADAAKFQRWRLNGQKTWDTLHQIIADASPANAGGVDIMLNSAEAAAKDKDPNFDIKKNLLGNLGDDFITYQKNPKSATFDDIASAPSIFLIGSPNPEQLGNALKLIASSFYQPPTEREFLGHKICSFQTGAPRAVKGQAAPAPNTISYTYNSGYVAISSDPAMLEEFLRSSGGDSKSLRDISGLADAAQKVGGSGTSLFGYSNENENMRIFLEALKNSPAGTDPFSRLGAMAMIGGMSAGQPKLADWIDVSLLPPFSEISKYFYFSVYSGKATSDGLYFKVFAPMPPGLK
jgi:hypothetical protein